MPRQPKPEQIVTAAAALTIDSLGDLDGGIFRLLADCEIDAMLKDLDDRGDAVNNGDGKPRVLKIEVEVIIDRGIYIITPRVQAKLPPRVSGSTAAKMRMRAKGQPELLFQATNPDNADQGTIDFPKPPGEDADS